MVYLLFQGFCDINVWMSNWRQGFDVNLTFIFDVLLMSIIDINLTSYQYQMPTGLLVGENSSC